MVYGLSGGSHKTVEAATPLQAALAKVKNDASLETMGKLVRNVAQNPGEDKFRKVRNSAAFRVAAAGSPAERRTTPARTATGALM
jgi:hypothetical protein